MRLGDRELPMVYDEDRSPAFLLFLADGSVQSADENEMLLTLGAQGSARGSRVLIADDEESFSFLIHVDEETLLLGSANLRESQFSSGVYPRAAALNLLQD